MSYEGVKVYNSLPAMMKHLQFKDFKTNVSKSLSTHLGASSMILYATISTYHMLETRLKSSVRDMPTDWRNIAAMDLTRDAETPRRLKRKLPQDL